MAEDYTPTTEVVKDAACFPRDRLGEPRGIDRDAFDRWLASIRAQALRDAAADCNCEDDWALLRDRADAEERGE